MILSYLRRQNELKQSVSKDGCNMIFAVLLATSPASHLRSVLQVRPDCPVALIQNNADKDGDDAMKVIPCEHQLPQQRKQVQFLRLHACEHNACLVCKFACGLVVQ